VFSTGMVDPFQPSRWLQWPWWGEWVGRRSGAACDEESSDWTGVSAEEEGEKQPEIQDQTPGPRDESAMMGVGRKRPSVGSLTSYVISNECPPCARDCEGPTEARPPDVAALKGFMETQFTYHRVTLNGCTTQWLLVDSQVCVTITTTHCRTSLSPPKKHCVPLPFPVPALSPALSSHRSGSKDVPT
jgi:hypothetical protein